MKLSFQKKKFICFCKNRGENLQMEEKNGVLNIFDTKTSSEIDSLNGIINISLNDDSKADHMYDTSERKVVPFLHHPTHELSLNTNELIDADKLMETLGLDWSKQPDTYDIQYIKIVQVKRHKRKRINKKWIKRYGYKKILVTGKGLKIKTGIDGSVEFIK